MFGRRDKIGSRRSVVGIGFAILIGLLSWTVAPSAFARGRSGGGRTSYGGGHHTESHGGAYRGGSGGSSHRGGTYSNPRTAGHYGTHK
jgi:hypothetical protein